MNQNPKLLIVTLVLSFSFEASGILGIYIRNLYFLGLKIFKVLILKTLFLFSNLVNQFLGKQDDNTHSYGLNIKCLTQAHVLN